MDDALKQYEDELELGFTRRLPRSGRKVVVFTIMLSFINDEKEYFKATLLGSDSYLLHILFHKLKLRLGYECITEKLYEIYTHRQIALIYCWGKFEDFERQRIPFYVSRLTATEIVDLELEQEQ